MKKEFREARTNTVKLEAEYKDIINEPANRGREKSNEWNIRWHSEKKIFM